MNTRSRTWCFTTNNYTDEDLQLLDEVKELTQYLCYGKEIAPTTKTPHLQGYIYFENAKSFQKIQKLLPKGSHIEVSKGTPIENKTYCEKEGSFKEYGTLPSQGKRNDLKVIKDEIIAGRGMKDIIEVATNYQSLRTAELLLKYLERKRDWKPHVVWIYGDSGSGKTRSVYDAEPKLYRKTNSTGKWWDGYDGDEAVLIDDVKDTSQSFYLSLLELLDRYDCLVETKGGSRQFLGRRIYVTSIKNPKDLFFEFLEAYELLRRIDEVRFLGKPIDVDKVEELDE